MHRLRHPYFLITATLMLGLLITFGQVKRPVKAEQEVNRRQKEEKVTSVKLMVPVWMWRGLRLNLAVAGALLALTPLAMRRFSAQRCQRAEAAPPLRRAEWLVLAGAVAIFTAAGTPRLGHSLWGDEEYAAGKFVGDEVTVAENGAVTIKPVPWQDTLWNYWRPTNHVGFTVVARLFHDTFFQRPTGPNDAFYSETLIRLPTLLAGMASILVLVWSCRVWGWQSAAVPLALVYSGHAWLVRFGVDARGYGFVVLLTLLLIGLLGRAVQTGQWRWWLGYGLAQFYLLWTYPGSIHVPASMNLAALWLIWRSESPADRTVQLTRWLVGNLVTVLLVVGLMAPLLVPFLAFLKINRLAGALDLAWFQDAAAYAVCGAPWHVWSSSNPFCTALSRDGWPAWLDIALLAVAWAAAAAGVWSVWQNQRTRGLLPFLVGGPVLLLAHLVVSHTKPYHWYLIPFLPALLFLWAASCNQLWQRHRPAALGLLLLLLLGVHGLAWPQSRLLVNHPIEANRESVALTRKVTNPRHPDYGKDAITASWIMTPGSYDPALVRFKNVEELRRLMERSRLEHKPLFVNFGFRDLYKLENPELLTILDDRSQFEPVAILPGLFFSTTREVVRYQAPSSAAR